MRYSDLLFSAEEDRIIEQAWNEGVLDWSSPDLLDIRMKVRNHHRAVQRDRCCYCRKDFVQGHPLEVDIEHILPKSKYRNLAITLVNLTIACKRCNMIVKRDRTDFISGSPVFVDDADLCNSDRYNFIHPNIDLYSNHIKVISLDVGDVALRRYMIVGGSGKGFSTVKYFLLRDLEEDTLDEIQGLSSDSGARWGQGIRAMLEL